MSKIKRPRGRPKKSGNLALDADIVETYERLRLSGMGRNTALVRVVDEVKVRHPGCKLSSTKVKVLLSEWQPEKGFLFQVGTPSNWKRGVFHVGMKSRLAPADLCLFHPEMIGQNITQYTISFSERPPYPKRGRQVRRKNISFGRKY